MENFRILIIKLQNSSRSSRSETSPSNLYTQYNLYSYMNLNVSFVSDCVRQTLSDSSSTFQPKNNDAMRKHRQAQKKLSQNEWHKYGESSLE